MSVEKTIQAIKEMRDMIHRHIDTVSPKEALHMTIELIDKNEEINNLMKAQRIINKYDMHTNKTIIVPKGSKVEIDDNGELYMNCSKCNTKLTDYEIQQLGYCQKCYEAI